MFVFRSEDFIAATSSDEGNEDVGKTAVLQASTWGSISQTKSERLIFEANINIWVFF